MSPAERPTPVITSGLKVAMALLIGLLATGVNPIPAAAETNDLIEITGRGWGHGRGLGQYGAYGYASEHGWTSSQILDHYYGATTAGPVPGTAPVDPGQVRVDLRFMRDRVTTVGLGDGTIVVVGVDNTELARVDTGSVRLFRSGDGFELQTSSSCSGPWVTHSALPARSTVRLLAESTAVGSDSVLHACGASYRTWYRGELRAVVDDGATRTVNVVTIEDYLRGVVPNEMPALWPSAALEAQAVAARSYAMAGDTRQQPYADTCDTTRCQVYDGVYTDRGGFRSSTHARTDDAIAATAGLVRLTSGGEVARTEFSSSTGGHTTGGDFPAVIDAGDSISANPNHTWTTVVDSDKIENRYRRGRLLSMDVVARDGLGPDGGRATRVEFRFERGTVTETGNTVRSFLGLKSDWFTPGPVGSGGLRSTSEGVYIDRTFRKLAGRTASSAEIARWHSAISSGQRRLLTNELVATDYFAGQMLTSLYQSALDRDTDAVGRSYWVGEMADGLKFESVGILVYGSEEYFLQRGGTDAAFVSALYQDILGRAADAAGRSYWESRLTDGIARRDDVVAGFYASLESRRDRADTVHEELLGPIPSAAVHDALADRLLKMDDLALAAEIAASSEAYAS